MLYSSSQSRENSKFRVKKRTPFVRFLFRSTETNQIVSSMQNKLMTFLAVAGTIYFGGFAAAQQHPDTVVAELKQVLVPVGLGHKADTASKTALRGDMGEVLDNTALIPYNMRPGMGGLCPRVETAFSFRFKNLSGQYVHAQSIFIYSFAQQVYRVAGNGTRTTLSGNVTQIPISFGAEQNANIGNRARQPAFYSFQGANMDYGETYGGPVAGYELSEDPYLSGFACAKMMWAPGAEPTPDLPADLSVTEAIEIVTEMSFAVVYNDHATNFYFTVANGSPIVFKYRISPTVDLNHPFDVRVNTSGSTTVLADVIRAPGITMPSNYVPMTATSTSGPFTETYDPMITLFQGQYRDTVTWTVFGNRPVIVWTWKCSPIIANQ